jgi:hypothetical protein
MEIPVLHSGLKLFPTNFTINYPLNPLKITRLTNAAPIFANTFAKVQLPNCIQIVLLYQHTILVARM